MIKVFRPELVLTDQQAADKKELLQKMTDFLVKKYIVDDADAFLQEVWTRETVMSTGVGRSVALPHASHPAIKEFVVTVWRLSEPLDYDSIDRKPVKIVFLVAVPPEMKAKYMRVLAAVSRFIRGKDNVSKLLTACDADHLYDLVNSIKINWEGKI